MTKSDKTKVSQSLHQEMKPAKVSQNLLEDAKQHNPKLWEILQAPQDCHLENKEVKNG
ncbi:MAG: hypothetical protein WBA93_17275 [Microcoleaceae cyanobacterium]